MNKPFESIASRTTIPIIVYRSYIVISIPIEVGPDKKSWFTGNLHSCGLDIVDWADIYFMLIHHKASILKWAWIPQQLINQGPL